jgi:hypothetical protein
VLLSTPASGKLKIGGDSDANLPRIGLRLIGGMDGAIWLGTPVQSQQWRQDVIAGSALSASSALKDSFADLETISTARDCLRFFNSDKWFLEMELIRLLSVLVILFHICFCISCFSKFYNYSGHGT